MKKLLALILALVMVMGLATVGASAATPVYSDKEDITFDEAVDVMSTVGVFQGIGDNTFSPSVELKRSEAAKIVAYLLTDNKTADAIPGSGKFSDVPSNHWAAGYIEYLDSQGVLSGRGNGIYDPDGKLIAIDFAKMLLVVLGYDRNHEGLVGNEYKINTSKLAMEAELFKGLSGVTTETVLTRDQAAQMAFNAIKAPTVRYENRGGSISWNGADITFGASDAVYVTTTIAKDQNISKRQLTNSGINNTQSGYTVEFGEKQYPDLRLDKNEDGFGRPVNDWSYGKDSIGKYIDVDAKIGEFTTAVTGADLVATIGEARIKNTDVEDFIYKVNGAKLVYASVNSGTPTAQSLAVGLENMVRSNVTPYYFTGNGVLTEVFVRDEQLYVTSIFTYLATANTDYNPVNGRVRFSIGSYSSKDNFTAVAPGGMPTTIAELDVKDFPGIDDMASKEVFLVRVYQSGNNLVAGEIKRAPKTEEVKVSVFQTAPSTEALNQFYSGYLEGDSKYTYGKTVYLDKLLRDYENKEASLASNYKLTYDWDGEYVIAAEPVSTVKNYLFLAGLNSNNNNLATGEAAAFAIFQDGVARSIKVNLLDTDANIRQYQGERTTLDDSAYRVNYDRLSTTTGHAYNRWFNYTKTGEGSSEIYTLTPVGTGTSNGDRTQIVSQSDAFSGVPTGNPYKTVDGVNLLHISAGSTRLVGDCVDDYATADDQTSLYVTGTDTYKTTAYFNTGSKIFTVGADLVDPYRNNAHFPYSISKVTNIYEGVQTANITAFPQMDGTEDEEDYAVRNPFNAVAWTVYDSGSQYIKYAIVMGADATQDTHYLYAIDTASSEELRSDGNYYWKLNAIVDGEYKTVTVKSKYNMGTIGSGASPANINGAVLFGSGGDTNNALYRATYDKDGNVTALSKAPYYSETDKYTYNNYQKSAPVYNLTATNLRQYSSDQVVYNTYDTDGDTLYLIGNTLYNKFDQAPQNEYISNTDVGLHIADGATIFVVQRSVERGSGLKYTDVQTFSDISRALGYLNARDRVNGALTNFRQTGSRSTVYDFKGYVAAGLDKTTHMAKWVVIKNLNDVDVDIDQTTNTKVNASLYATETPTNTLVFKLDGTSISNTPTDLVWEIWGAPQTTQGAAEDRIMYNGTVTVATATPATTISFGKSGTGADVVVVQGGLTTGYSYFIVVKNGAQVWTTNRFGVFGS